MGQMKAKLGFMMVLIFVLAWGLPVLAAEYPTKPITLIIPHPAGGSTDLTIRPLANAAQKYLGKPIVCENVGGGGGVVGPSLVVTKPADGYTIGVMLRGAVVAWHMGSINFNPMTDVTHIMTYSGLLNGIVVKPESPWKTIQEFLEYSRKNPEKVSYGSPGVGTLCHIRMEELAMMAGDIKWIHVPYKGDAGCVPALLGGHVDSLSVTSGGFATLVDGGKFRLLATYADQRPERFLQAPTLKEVGYDIVEMVAMEVIGPKGLPQPVVQKLHDSFKKAMDAPEFLNALKTFDMPKLYANTDDTIKSLRKDFEVYGKIIQKLGLQKK